MATLNFKGLPCEIVVFFSAMIFVIIIGCAALFAKAPEMISVSDGVLYGAFGAVFVAYVIGTLVRGRPHFRRNLAGLDEKVKRVAKKYFVIPSALSLVVLLFDLARSDEAWSARVSVNHDVEDPSKVFCEIENIGTILSLIHI